jgi:predicted ATPase
MNETQKKIEARLNKTLDFCPYIEHIRFPMYKSLEDGLTLTFNWPVTALIGPNGTNKSSVLQAISAAPEGRSLAQFWFSTEVDDIDSGPRGDATHRFIYKYRFDGSGVSAECRKYRGSKRYRSVEVPRELQGKRDPDYWEPTKRVSVDGMSPIPMSGFDKWLSNNRDRWNQIKKDVTYLDFRSELSAFDKYIYHQSFSRWTPDATQKRYKVVLRSKWVARALSGRSLPKKERKDLIQSVRALDDISVQEIAKILGKPIERILIVEHKFFGPQGYTVRLQLGGGGATYSEAHAGSGEYAVVRLVDCIKRAPERSLILLDEPEVSLHPGAQAKLMDFIEAETLRHCHQVVISTHSPALVASLPPQAIKVFGYDTARHRVVLVADACSPTEAFAHLGHTTIGSHLRLIVEDELAAEIARAALRRYAPKKLDTLEVVAFPGGAGSLVKNVLPALAIGKFEKAAILLDGDQTPETRNMATDIPAAAESRNLNELIELWRDQFHKTVPNLHSDSDHARDAENLLTCLNWSHHHLGYLPGGCPEQALVSAMGEDYSNKYTVDWKQYWLDKVRTKLYLTDEEDVTSDLVFNLQQTELAHLPFDASLLKDAFTEIVRIIEW